MHKKIVLSLSHIDLDGISCQIVLRNLYGDIRRMNTTYGKINEYLNIIEDYISRIEPDEVFITDLAFKLDQIERLNEIASKNENTNFTFIDHHPFGEEYKHLNRDNFKIIITDKASATKLTYFYLKKRYPEIENKELSKYVDYVNAYDIWLKDEKEFKVGFVYNELFWSYKIEYFWSIFKDNYKLRNKDKEKYKDILSKKNKLFNKLENSGRVMKFSNRILLIFLDDYQSFVTIDYPDFLFYVIVRSTGGISVRLNEEITNYNIKDNIVQKILKLPYIEEAGGHEGAFGISVIDSNPHILVEFSKILVQYIDEELENINK